MKKYLIGFIIITLAFGSCAKVASKHVESEPEAEPEVEEYKISWTDSIYNGMTLEEKVGQLFMVAAYSNRKPAHTDTLQKLIKEHHIGGLIFFQGGPVRQARMTNQFQAASKVPLFIGIDGEWGLKMRLDSTARYPYNMTLGAIKDNDILKEIGTQIGHDCNRMGIHINFAPVVDINTNSKNPVIGVRSYGEDKYNVTKKAIAFTEGMESTGVLGSAKHFPGHGDTSTDSHKTLPTVSFSKARLDSVELYTYKKLFKKGVAGVMVAHLNVPSLESQENLPSSLSYTIVTELLKQQLGYQGLIFTDALNMKGAANYKQPGDIDLAAFLAGNDVLLFTENAPKAISKIVEAYQQNVITEERLSHSVKKILEAKFKAGLDKYKPIELENLVADLNGEVNQKLYAKAIKNAITLLKNDKKLLPLNKKAKVGFVKIGDGSEKSFLKSLKDQSDIKDLSGLSQTRLIQEVKKYDKVIISYHRKNARLTRNMSKADKQLIETIAKNSNTILTVFASQYCLKDVDMSSVESVLIAYENDDNANQLTADMIFGKEKPNGRLPASISADFPVNAGISYQE